MECEDMAFLLVQSSVTILVSVCLQAGNRFSCRVYNTFL